MGSPSRVGEAGVFPGADAVLDMGVSTVTGFQRDRVAVGVGAETGVAPAVDGAEQRQLSPGVWPFTPADQQAPGTPVVELDKISEFDHVPVLAACPVEVAGRLPVFILGEQ